MEPKLCINCKYHRVGQEYGGVIPVWFGVLPVTSPVNLCDRFKYTYTNPVDGRKTEMGEVKCSSERSAGKCGLEGRLFEPKE